MWFRDKREKEQQRLCNIQRDDDAVTSQTPQEPTTSNAGDALLHRRIMKCMCDYKSKEETVLHLLDQYDQHMLVPVKVEGVKISPEPVVSGKDAIFKISGEDISGGRVVIKVSYFGFHVPIFMTSVMRHAV
ncbi:hypothetical protein Bca4012_101197 [Brassica carinata]